MANIAISFGLVLVVLGIVGYFGSGMVSLTALIPAAFGLVLLVLGAVARDPEKRKHAMHVAAMIGVLGFLGSARGLGKLIPLLSGQPVERPGAVIAQSVMAILMLIFTWLCVRSFINARRSRTI
jgi:ABC-type Na+ efflux pump permease subunit